jgi:hypothetical protein
MDGYKILNHIYYAINYSKLPFQVHRIVKFNLDSTIYDINVNLRIPVPLRSFTEYSSTCFQIAFLVSFCPNRSFATYLL